MDSMDSSAATSTGDNQLCFHKKTRNWHKRLHLRKAAVQPPTMQSKDKRGPKKIAEEWEQSKVWPSSKKTPRKAQQSERRTNDSRNTLQFTCSQCRDNLEYVPKDLVRHFEENHRGSPPVFPCHVCSFNTHDFSCLQVHLLSHKDTFSTCSICNDNIQRTWPEFSAHLTMYHCQNGKYSCETCQRFSTGDVRLFLEHMCVHGLSLEGANADLSLPIKDKKQRGPETTTQTLRCQLCGYEASQKWLITKHVKAVHVCQNGNQRKKKKELHSIAMKPKDPIPKMKPRLTRSAVREMCWLTQDCLSLPGREFLDKYCHLSDPQTTLEETQQFLMKSVAGESGEEKWTKALKTVLSNVPQDVNLHPKSENGIMGNSSDLTVLTVKNKITVAQHGAAYAKKSRRMTSSEKNTVLPESGADDARCVGDQNGCQSSLNDHMPSSQTETKLHNDMVVSAQPEASECTRMQENRENQELKTEETEEDAKKHPEPMHEDVIDISSELKLTNESAEQTPVHKVLPKIKRQKRRRKRKAAPRKVDKRSSGQPLKIVLKKNPVKEKQWVSQSSLSPSGVGATDDCPHETVETTEQLLHDVPLTEAQQKKWTKTSKADVCDPAEGNLQSEAGGELIPSGAAVELTGSENMAENEAAGALQGPPPSTHRETGEDSEESQQFTETEAGKRSSADEVEMMCPESLLQTSGGSLDLHVSDSERSSADAQSASQPVITPQGKSAHYRSYTDLMVKDLISSGTFLSCSLTFYLKEHFHLFYLTGKANLEDASLALCVEQQETEVPADALRSSDHLPVGKAIQQEPSPATGRRWQPAPKSQERTLKLVAINPSQLVKRPAGDQPVVVLNHPDADIPEVARIMEVVNRYRGEVQKVTLSRRTLKALSAVNSEGPETDEPTDDPDSAGSGDNSVQERFILKMKFRRLSRKKYEVVGVVSPSKDVVTEFRCWFCGRIFVSQEMWMVHRQRHLMEWRRPNCENSLMSHTLDEKQHQQQKQN